MNMHGMTCYEIEINEAGPWEGVVTGVLGRNVGPSQRYFTFRQLADRPYVYRSTYAIGDRATKKVVMQDFKRQSDAAKCIKDSVDQGWEGLLPAPYTINPHV